MMRIVRSSSARADLTAHFVHLAEQAGDSTADRFLQCVRESTAPLAQQPEIGALVDTLNPALAGIRKWRVREFDHFLIFYLPRENDVLLVRVLHTAQDWWSMLDVAP